MKPVTLFVTILLAILASAFIIGSMLESECEWDQRVDAALEEEVRRC